MTREVMSSTRGKNPTGRNHGGNPKFKRGPLPLLFSDYHTQLNNSPAPHTRLPGGQWNCPTTDFELGLPGLWGLLPPGICSTPKRPHWQGQYLSLSPCRERGTNNTSQVLGFQWVNRPDTSEITPTFLSLGSVTCGDLGLRSSNFWLCHMLNAFEPRFSLAFPAGW